MAGDLDPDTVTALVCGLDHTLVVAEGTLYACGWGADGQTGETAR